MPNDTVNLFLSLPLAVAQQLHLALDDALAPKEAEPTPPQPPASILVRILGGMDHTTGQRQEVIPSVSFSTNISQHDFAQNTALPKQLATKAMLDSGQNLLASPTMLGNMILSPDNLCWTVPFSVGPFEVWAEVSYEPADANGEIIIGRISDDD